MTEVDWLNCPDPNTLLQFLADRSRRPGSRKLRLFACACVGRLGPLLQDRRCREAVRLSERFAEGEFDTRRLGDARRAAQELARQAWLAWRGDPRREQPARIAQAIVGVTAEDAIAAAWETARAVADALKGDEAARQSELVRDVFGNPFRPLPLLPVNDGTIARLATAIYAEGRFQDLPVLGDALEDAGCVDPAVLGHCREPGEHVRGCWVVDWARAAA